MKPEIKYGILGGLSICAWIMAEYLLGFHNKYYEIGKYSGYFATVIPIFSIYLALKRRDLEGSMSSIFVGDIRSGFIVSCITALIMTIFLLLYNCYINPGWIDTSIAVEKCKLVQQGFTDIVINKKLEEIRLMNSNKALVINGIALSVAMGLIISAILSLILRRKKRVTA